MKAYAPSSPVMVAGGLASVDPLATTVAPANPAPSWSRTTPWMAAVVAVIAGSGRPSAHGSPALAGRTPTNDATTSPPRVTWRVRITPIARGLGVWFSEFV